MLFQSHANRTLLQKEIKVNLVWIHFYLKFPLNYNTDVRMMIILESDAGILGKKKSECSYQESNLRPSDY